MTLLLRVTDSDALRDEVSVLVHEMEIEPLIVALSVTDVLVKVLDTEAESVILPEAAALCDGVIDVAECVTDTDSVKVRVGAVLGVMVGVCDRVDGVVEGVAEYVDIVHRVGEAVEVQESE